MITLTPRAAARIAELEQDVADSGRLLRLFVEPGGCSGYEYGMSFDEQKEDDKLVESEGRKILLDPQSATYLHGSVVDFDDGLQGKGFDIKNPNAESTCGCGRSFS